MLQLTSDISKVLVSGLLVLIMGCSGRYLKPYSEVVMSPGMRIEGTNLNGTVLVTAGDGTLRSYKGDGWETSIRLISRPTRWNDSLGLFDPAGSSSPFGRLIVQEGRLHFSSVDDAMRWLYVGSLDTKPVFTNNGLVFSYAIARPRESWQGAVRTVEIWQLYINGKRPTNLPGADDHAIKVIGGSIPDLSQPYPAPVGRYMVLGDEPYDPRNPPK
jgi:hypothetical protein